MKIRTQFYLLIAGIVIVPLFVLAGFYYLQRSRETTAILVPGYDEVSRLAGGTVDRASWEELTEFLSHKPRTVDFVILDVDRRVLFSTMEAHKSGDLVSDEDLLGYIRETSGDYIYQLDSPVRASEGGLLVLSRIRREARRPPDPFQRFFSTVLALLLILFAFSAVMSVIIARSITDSVLVLEEATRRMAAGELDLAIEARGSNEITSLTTSLNRMRLALKDDQARRSRFIMGITHDLKTPLALIKGYAEAIGDGIADDQNSRERYVDIIGAKVDQLDGMIEDLIDFVRVDTGEWRRRLTRIPLAGFLRNFCKRMTVDAALLKRRTESEIILPEELSVPLDERLVYRALENIVNNALRYTREDGLIRIGARLEAGVAVIEITDDGPGIDATDLPNIFDLFYRGTASRREQGMGLGLSVVKNVVESHGWEIKVTSERERGSVFTIRIPVDGPDF